MPDPSCFSGSDGSFGSQTPFADGITSARQTIDQRFPNADQSGAWNDGAGAQVEITGIGFLFVDPKQPANWAGLRAAAVAVGIRQAARQAARNLPPDEQERFVQRAMKRCSRQKWLVKSQQDKADAVVTSPSALSANVRKGSDVLSEVLAEDSRETRIGLSVAARRAAKTFAKMPGSKVIRHAQAHRHVTASAGLVHSWDDKGNPIPFSLNVLNLDMIQSVEMREADSRSDNATP